VITVLIIAGLLWNGQKGLSRPVLRYSFTSGNQRLSLTIGPVLAISPDGTEIAYLTTANGSTNLYLRRQSDFQAVPVLGAENSFYRVFSPDGKWLAFQAGGKLKKVPASGGPAVNITDVGDPRGISWISADEIIFTAGTTGDLQIVNANGGPPRPLT